MIESLLSLTFWVRDFAWVRGAGPRRAIGRCCALTVALALLSTTAAAQQAGGEGAASENLYERIEQVQREGGRIVVQPSVDSVGQPGVWDYGSTGATGAQTAQAEQRGFDAGAYERLAQNSMSVLDRSQQGVAAFRSRLEAIVAAAPSAYDEMRATLASASPTGEPQYFLKVFLVVVAGLTVGWLFERLVYGYRIVGPWFVAQQVPNPQGYTEKLPILALRVLLTIGGIAIACTVSIMLGLVFYEPHEATQKTAIVILATYALIRLTEATWRMVISPFLPNYRIPCFDDRQAIKLFRWLYFVAAFSLTSLAGCLWMEALGLPFEIHVLMTSGFSLLTVLLNFALIRANHGAISYAILGGCTGEGAGGDSVFRRRVGGDELSFGHGSTSRRPPDRRRLHDPLGDHRGLWRRLLRHRVDLPQTAPDQGDQRWRLGRRRRDDLLHRDWGPVRGRLSHALDGRSRASGRVRSGRARGGLGDLMDMGRRGGHE